METVIVTDQSSTYLCFYTIHSHNGNRIAAATLFLPKVRLGSKTTGKLNSSSSPDSYFPFRYSSFLLCIYLSLDGILLAYGSGQISVRCGTHGEKKHGKNYSGRIVLLDLDIENSNIIKFQFIYSHWKKVEFINLSQV